MDPDRRDAPFLLRRGVIVPLAVWLLLALGCSATSLVQQRPQVTVLPTRTLAPTFTPTPAVIPQVIVITPPAGETPGVIIVPEGVQPQIIVEPLPTATFTPTPPPDTPTPTPTATNTPTATPTATPTPFVEIVGGLVALRSGPGVAYPLVAQLGPGVPVALVGRNPEGTWYQICCVNGQSVWVAARHVTVHNDISQLPLVSAGPPPTPTATPTPTITPTPTPYLYPFELAIGPQFFPTNNPFLTIWVKLFIGEPPNEVAAEGYYLKVLFEGFERPSAYGNMPSMDHFELSAPPGAGNSVEYNLKYEYHPPDLSDQGGPSAIEALGTGEWTVFVIDGAGNQLSEPVTFTTAPWNTNREIYIGWRRVR